LVFVHFYINLTLDFSQILIVFTLDFSQKLPNVSLDFSQIFVEFKISQAPFAPGDPIVSLPFYGIESLMKT